MKKEYITSNSDIMKGKPVIAGTRITVELILEKLSSGESADQIISEQSGLTKEAINAALAFVAKALTADVINPANKISR